MPSAVAYCTVTALVAAGASVTTAGIAPADSEAEASDTESAGGLAGGTTVTLTTVAPTNPADVVVNAIVNFRGVFPVPVAGLTWTLIVF